MKDHYKLLDGLHVVLINEKCPIISYSVLESVASSSVIDYMVVYEFGGSDFT